MSGRPGPGAARRGDRWQECSPTRSPESEQTLAAAAAHTCEPRAAPPAGRPCAPTPAGSGPRQAALQPVPPPPAASRTHVLRGPAGADPRGRRRLSGKSKGTNTPPPPAPTGGNRNVTPRDPAGPRSAARRAGARNSPHPERPAPGARPRPGRAPHVLRRSPPTWRPGGQPVGLPRPGPRCGATSGGLPSARPSVPSRPLQDGPDPGTEMRARHRCSLFVRPPRTAPARGQNPKGSPDSRVPAGSAPAAGQGRGAGRSPLRPEVPGRLPPGVAAGRGPGQQERDAGSR